MTRRTRKTRKPERSYLTEYQRGARYVWISYWRQWDEILDVRAGEHEWSAPVVTVRALEGERAGEIRVHSTRPDRRDRFQAERPAV